jgi:hypothetical protein
MRNRLIAALAAALSDPFMDVRGRELVTAGNVLAGRSHADSLKALLSEAAPAISSWAAAAYLKDDDIEDAEGDHEVTCSKCFGVGDLLCCDGCPRAYHVSCVNAYGVPSGKWLCPECKRALRARATQDLEVPDSSGGLPRELAVAIALLGAKPRP